MKLLVIDMQKGFMDNHLYNYDAFVKQTQKIISVARENNIETIYFQHDCGTGTGYSIGDETFEIAQEVAPRNGEKVFIKNKNSCFTNNEFMNYITNANDKKLIIIGLQTDFCIDATVKSAFEKGYEVIIPEGTNSTFDNKYMNNEYTYKYFNEMIWPNRFAKCISVEKTIKIMKSC